MTAIFSIAGAADGRAKRRCACWTAMLIAVIP
jgi:hypothetical protein